MPGPMVGMGAIIECSEGGAPVPYKVLPENMVMATAGPAGCVLDFKPVVNVGTFGKCSILKPPVCVPVIVGPWKPGAPTVLVGGKPAVNKDAKCNCALGGEIKVTFPGPPTTVIP
ncbi:DUF4280 domain-containing protein [Alphaproteobacteria bacterium]|nr:DUF4280 domain-containing protein [Alphaproteobacteria bacterium]MDC0344800.1 DUF4280 domain-containing protein [Alphaproteobacteria bacterium]